MMRLSFHGADRGVTGSCHLIECAGTRVLIDCGMYQGSGELHEENAEPFGFDVATVEYVLLTHAHLDHCGRLPLLVQRGFRGEIITTSATRELARLVLLDAAHLQEEEARYRQRKSHERRGGHEDGPLYTTLDALNSFDYFGRTAVYGQPLELAPGLRVTFVDAGHILGSASVLVELDEQAARRSVLFSGDIGNAGRPLLSAPVAVKAEAVVMETTYGDRQHKSLTSSVAELYEVVTDTFRRGGKVIVPTFALERAQELLYFLREGREQGRLPQSLPVFLDSPMAISATQIFEHHPECFKPETRKLFSGRNDPFQLPELHFCREMADSIAINRVTSGAIIMAGSGMCTGGRIRHHLRNSLGRSENSIIFVGFAASGTLARQIIDGAKQVSLFGEQVPVRASIHTIGGFSAHADQTELLDWHRQTHAARTFLVHGDDAVIPRLAALLHNTMVEMPKLNEAFEL